MPSRILLNISEPREDDEEQGEAIVVPDTGTLSMENGGSAPIDFLPVIGVATMLLAVFAVVTIIIARIRNKKKISFEAQKSYKGFHLKKNLLPRCVGLATLILVFMFAITKLNSTQGGAEAYMFGGEEVDTLSITMEDVAVDVEMENKAAFGLGSTEITINSATQTGYTLLAYVDSETTNLVKQDGDGDLVVKMINEEEGAQGLMENTWGVALEAPINQYSPIFRGLPETEEKAMVVNVSGTNPTPAGDKVTLYYGAYVTPDLEYGIYSGATINYIAVAHVVTSEDVTVRFHSNGFYFDEDKTEDLNTVVYGNVCELEYIGIGGGCRVVHVADIEPLISKTPNIDDDRQAEEGYENDLLYVDSIKYEGADMLRVELMYGLEEGYDYLYLYEGERNIGAGQNLQEDVITVVNGGDIRGDLVPGGMTTFYVDGDAMTFAFKSDGSERYYGYYAYVLPVYFEEPSGVDSFEEKLCRMMKSDNIDEDGNLEYSYSDEYTIVEPISVPGAKKVKVEIEYALTANTAEIAVASGVWSGNWDDDPDDLEFHTYRPDGQNVSGVDEFVVDGNVVTFMMNTWGIPEEDYDYGFYARLYPIYDEEHEGTYTMQNCSFGRKSGEYKVPIVNNYNGYEDYWYYTVDLGGNPHDGETIWVGGEKEIIAFIKEFIDLASGRTVDVYAESFLEVIYEGNGGVLPEDYDDDNIQRIWNFDTRSIWRNFYRREGYTFLGWNTKPDGSGEWYQPDTDIKCDGREGETITLYAQWGA